MSRLYEGIVESFPQALLQLYIFMQRADGAIDILLFASIITSILSLAAGVSQFEQWNVENDKKYYIPMFSKYFIVSQIFHVSLKYLLWGMILLVTRNAGFW